MKDTGIVYVSLGMLLLRPPGRVAYHLKGRSEWPTYINGEPTGHELHWTRCGLPTYDDRNWRRTILDAIRLDNARLVARPCRRCAA
jgi:hypothetical protein